MRTAILILGVLFVALPCLGLWQRQNRSVNKSPEWQFIDTSGNNKHYYRRSSLERTTQDVIKVWVKYVPVNLDIERKKEVEDPANERALEYVRYSYGLTLFDVDCGTKKARVRQVDDYDIYGTLIRSAKLNENEADWLKGSFLVKLANAVCRRS